MGKNMFTLEHLRTDGRDEMYPTPTEEGRHARLRVRTLPYSTGSAWYLVVGDPDPAYMPRHSVHRFPDTMPDWI